MRPRAKAPEVGASKRTCQYPCPLYAQNTRSPKPRSADTLLRPDRVARYGTKGVGLFRPVPCSSCAVTMSDLKKTRASSPAPARAYLTPRSNNLPSPCKTRASDGDEQPDEAQVLLLLLGRKDLARILNVSERTIGSLRARGRLPAPTRLGRRTLWKRSEIERWVAAGCPPRDQWEAMSGGAA